MTSQAIIVDGKAVAAKVRAEARARAAVFQQAHARPPGLALVQVGAQSDSAIYVRGKHKACEEAGIASFAYTPPDTVTREELLALVGRLNADERVDGILLQLPLPAGIDANESSMRSTRARTSTASTRMNTGLLAQKRPGLRPCTSWGVIRLAQRVRYCAARPGARPCRGSNTSGRPMALELLLAGATVTVATPATRDLRAEVERAEILVSAAGKAGLVRGEWIREGAAVFDVGINRNESTGRMVGDVEFEAAALRAGWITPVPGGIGPMTIAMLMSNTLDAATAAK